MLWMSELGIVYSFKIHFTKDNVRENVLGAKFYIEHVFVGDYAGPRTPLEKRDVTLSS